MMIGLPIGAKRRSMFGVCGFAQTPLRGSPEAMT
jgi:hypothetical protein